MGALITLSRLIDRITEVIGKSASWLILVSVLVSAANATIRKVFNTSSNAWLELQWYLFGAVFLLGAAYTFQMNEHIRIDIVSSRLPKAVRNWIEIIGHVLFLTPFCLIVLYTGIPFFKVAFLTNEYSASAGGLILWPAKLMLPLGFFLLFLQAMSELIKRIAIMRGLIPDNLMGGGSHGSVE